MADQLQLDIVTPERRVLSEAVDSVNVPGSNGEFGLLPGHAALISQLRSGVLTYSRGGVTERLFISGGFVEVNDDRVSVLAEIAERPGEVDVAAARSAREQAEKMLNKPAADPDEYTQARAELDRATARLQLAGGGSQ